MSPTTCNAGEACVGSVVCQTRSNSAHGLVKRAGKVYGYLALTLTIAVTYPLWVTQRPSRLALTTVLTGILWLFWSLS